jgi:hypothetical protein
MTDNKKIKAFLKDLTELSIKHNLVIGGCGCCGSPWIASMDRRLTDFDELEFDFEKQCYRVLNDIGKEVKAND